MAIEFSQRQPIGEGETGEGRCGFTRRLIAGETLSNPTAVEIGASPTNALPTELPLPTNADLTIATVAINATTIEIDEELNGAALPGKAVTFLVSGQKAGTTYQVRVECDTSRGQHLVRDAFLVCV